MLPSSPTYGPVGSHVMVLSSNTNSPCHSTSARSGLRVGKLAPRPHATPSDTLNSRGSPRSLPPAMLVSSTRPSSRLATRSMIPVRSLVLAHELPDGNWIAKRGARLKASPRACEIRFHLAPKIGRAHV